MDFNGLGIRGWRNNVRENTDFERQEGSGGIPGVPGVALQGSRVLERTCTKREAGAGPEVRFPSSICSAYAREDFPTIDTIHSSVVRNDY